MCAENYTHGLNDKIITMHSQLLTVLFCSSKMPGHVRTSRVAVEGNVCGTCALAGVAVLHARTPVPRGLWGRVCVPATTPPTPASVP